MRILLSSVMLAFALLASGCEGQPQRPAEFPGEVGPGRDEVPDVIFRKDGELVFLRDGEELIRIDIEIADTESARTRGLMERESLPPMSGMLFIFDNERPRSFWMANTPLSLDIMFASSDSQLVTIRKYTRPMSPQSVTSEDPARFVVEVPAGFADTNGIIEGDRITWRRTGE